VHFIFSDKDDQDFIIYLYTVPAKIMVPEILFEPLKSIGPGQLSNTIFKVGQEIHRNNVYAAIRFRCQELEGTPNGIQRHTIVF
jgi:hypothetical protein